VSRNAVTSDDVRIFVTSFLNRKLQEQQRDLLQDLNDDYDLFLSGAIDSLGFVELVAATCEHFGCEIDLEGLDPDKMTVMGPLCVYILNELHKT
jgi:acyl carrier protein